MIDTQDLPSYIPGYDEYLEQIEKSNKSEETYDFSDEIHDEFMIRGGCEIMNREIIDLSTTELLVGDLEKLKDYVWQGEKLIPHEMIEG